MKRTQLYLDEELWNALHAQARRNKTTVSELVREAVRERYLSRPERQKNAMQAFVGIRSEGPRALDSVEYVRRLRRGSRLDRIHR